MSQPTVGGRESRQNAEGAKFSSSVVGVEKLESPVTVKTVPSLPNSNSSSYYGNSRKVSGVPKSPKVSAKSVNSDVGSKLTSSSSEKLAAGTTSGTTSGTGSTTTVLQKSSKSSTQNGQSREKSLTTSSTNRMKDSSERISSKYAYEKTGQSTRDTKTRPNKSNKASPAKIISNPSGNGITGRGSRVFTSSDKSRPGASNFGSRSQNTSGEQRIDKITIAYHVPTYWHIMYPPTGSCTYLLAYNEPTY